MVKTPSAKSVTGKRSLTVRVKTAKYRKNRPTAGWNVS